MQLALSAYYHLFLYAGTVEGHWVLGAIRMATWQLPQCYTMPQLTPRRHSKLRLTLMKFHCKSFMYDLTSSARFRSTDFEAAVFVLNVSAFCIELLGWFASRSTFTAGMDTLTLNPGRSGILSWPWISSWSLNFWQISYWLQLYSLSQDLKVNETEAELKYGPFHRPCLDKADRNTSAQREVKVHRGQLTPYVYQNFARLSCTTVNFPSMSKKVKHECFPPFSYMQVRWLCTVFRPLVWKAIYHILATYTAFVLHSYKSVGSVVDNGYHTRYWFGALSSLCLTPKTVQPLKKNPKTTTTTKKGWRIAW